MTPFVSGQRVQVLAYTGRWLPAVVAEDDGRSGLLRVRHEPADDQLCTATFVVPRARVRAAVTPPKESAGAAAP